MTERLSALFCIGCGRIDVPEPCVGDCDHAANRHASELTAVVRQVAWVTPRPGEEERTWQSLRSRAETALTS